jgi:cytoskeletal protein RodZ
MNEQTLLMNEQAELLSEIGAYLQNLRQRQEISLEDVASTTLIPVRTLAAIEAGDLNRLPEPVYVQGFIKRYADAIGVDGTEFANAFPTGMSSRPAKRTWRGHMEAQLRPVHLYLVYTFLVIGSISGLSYLLNRSAGQQPRFASTTQVESQMSAPAPADFYGPPAPAQANLATPPKVAKVSNLLTDKPVRVSLTVKGQQSWLRITVDGKTEFEGMLQQGTQRTWTGNEAVTVRAGDAGAVEVSYNESQPQPLGTPGDVQEKTFGKTTAVGPATWNEEPTATATIAIRN